MGQQISDKEVFGLLGACLAYPSADCFAHFAELDRRVSTASNMALYHFQEFVANVRQMTLPQWQEYYVRTFDVTPQCGLYLSVYIFGEENYKRAELMTGLKALYDKHGVYEMTELPDHLSVVLKQYALFSEEEWSEIVSMCIIPAIEKMIALLEKHNNPYAFLLKTIKELCVTMENVNV